MDVAIKVLRTDGGGKLRLSEANDNLIDEFNMLNEISAVKYFAKVYGYINVRTEGFKIVMEYGNHGSVKSNMNGRTSLKLKNVDTGG